MLRDQVVSVEFRVFHLKMCQVLPTAKYPRWLLIFLFPLPHFISRNVTKYLVQYFGLDKPSRQDQMVTLEK